MIAFRCIFDWEFEVFGLKEKNLIDKKKLREFGCGRLGESSAIGEEAFGCI